MSGTGFKLWPESKESEFDKSIRPHLNAAYNLTRYLTQNEADAEDVLQEALLRAFRFFDHSRDLKPWFLQIVRNCAYTSLKERGRYLELTENDIAHLPSDKATAETFFLEAAALEDIRSVIYELPEPFREVLVLRELEQMSYEEIALVTNLPQGTVMSRLARARARFREIFTARHGGIKP